MKKILYSILIGSLTLFNACSEDDLEPTLATSKDVETSITSQEDLKGLLNGLYDRFTSTYYYGRDLIIFGEVRSDNCFSSGNSGRFITPSAMNLVESDGYALNTWSAIYQVIASANIIIGQDPAKITGDEAEIKQIIGQAYVARALAHFDALQLFGQQNVYVNGTLGTAGIPYITTYKGGDLYPTRQSVSEVKDLIYKDLDNALSFLSESLNGDSQYFSTYAAYAIKARVATYFKDWSVAKTAAESVINANKYSIIEANAFVDSWKTDNNANDIFELAYSATDNNSINGLQYIYRGDSYGDIEVLDDLLSIYDNGDIRASSDIIGYEGTKLRNLGKYPASDYSDNIPLIRYEEVVLIYAEALIELGNANALNVLNEVPAKRNAQLYTAATKENVLLERRKELAFEGFRFNDLARTGKDIPLVDDIKQTHNGPKYGSYNYAFPIPISELDANSSITQNEGY